MDSLKLARDVLARHRGNDATLGLMRAVLDHIVSAPIPDPKVEAFAREAFDAALQIVREVEKAVAGGVLPSKHRQQAIRSLLVVDVESLPERRAAVVEFLDWVRDQAMSDEQKAKMVCGMALANLGGMGTSDADYAAAMPFALAAVKAMSNPRGRGKVAPVKKDAAIAALFAHFGCEVSAATARRNKRAKL